jgi:hypothetical protein
MDVAYSKEYEKVLDPEKAYELFWEGYIKDFRGFTCSELDCDAQVTLANARRERHSMKQRPNFRCYGEHKKGCTHKKEKKIKCLDILVLGDRKQKKKMNKEEAKRKYHSDSKSGNRQSEYRTIMPLVNKYIQYEQSNDLASFEILNQGKKLKYSEMFIEMENQTFDFFTEFNRIYFGTARVVKNPEKEDYILFFLKKLKYKGKSYKPTAYISKKIIENSYKNKLWQQELSLYAEDKHPVKVFLYGKPVINEINDKAYLNLQICKAKLDFVDIRRID